MYCWSSEESVFRGILQLRPEIVLWLLRCLLHKFTFHLPPIIPSPGSYEVYFYLGYWVESQAPPSAWLAGFIGVFKVWIGLGLQTPLLLGRKVAGFVVHLSPLTSEAARFRLPFRRTSVELLAPPKAIPPRALPLA